MPQSPEKPVLSVIIPTRDREAILAETVGAVLAAIGDEIELIVVEDGSVDDTAVMLEALAGAGGGRLTLVTASGGGPAQARNSGIERASASVCLMLDDDVKPGPALLQRHVDFHRRNPSREAALLGLVVPAPRFATDIARWAHERGALFAYAELDADRPVPPTRFWSANASLKTDLLRDAGGFDESLRFFEDVELASRLSLRGLTISYDPEAVGEHAQEISLEGLMARAGASGPYFHKLVEKVPRTRLPRRPGVRHRIKSGVLSGLLGAGVRPESVKHAAWRFLIDEAQRESVWGNEEGKGRLRIGETLRRRC